MPATDLDEIDRLIGRNIRFHRLRCELSQVQLTARLGISFQQLQKYERAFNRIAASRLLRIAGTLRVPISDFYAEVERTSSPSLASGREQAQLLQAYSKIRGSERRRLIVDLLQHLASE